MGIADPGTAQAPQNDRPDTGDMVAVHQMFRHELRTLSALIATADIKDATTQAARLEAHLRLVLDFLENHHEGEDALLWPMLEAKAAVDAELVGLMSVHHAELDQLIGEVRRRAANWVQSGERQDRDLLALQLGQLREILHVHLDAEERFILPLVRQHLSVKEWALIAHHGAAGTPRRPRAALVLLGIILEDAGPGERASFWATLPPPARVAWHAVGRRFHARHQQLLRSTASA